LDVIIYLVGGVVLGTLTALGLKQNGVEWAVLPGFGMILGIFLSLAVYQDGSLLNGATTIASAGTPDWEFIGLTPVLLTVTAGLSAIYKVGKSF